MKKEQYGSIKFEDLAFPRYAKVKESIEALTRIIDFEKVKDDGIDRVLHAILQLIDENDDKTIDEKREVIEDAIYNGNIFKHYFSEENLSKAVEVLSKTTLLNDEERLIYIINFFMPGDVNFSSIYSKNGKDIQKITEYYSLNGEDANNLVYARISEISKFYKLYQEEKERQRIQTLAAMQDATEEPNATNIDRVRMLLDNLLDGSLKETLEQQLQALEQAESLPEVLESLEVEAAPITEELGQEILIEEVPVSEEVLEENLSELEETQVIEPAPLDEVLQKENVQGKSEDGIGKNVMASLQSLVADARNNAQRVEQLSFDLETKDKQLVELQATVDSQQQEIQEKNESIEAKIAELEEKDRKIEEQDYQLALLTSELEARDASLAKANNVIANKDEEIKSLNISLQAYKTSLGEIQNFLTTAQYGVEIDENPRKVA